MNNKLGWLATAFVLSACGTGAGLDLPRLQSGEARIYHYNCADAEGMDVEYAHMASIYSATIQILDGKKVLNRETDGAFRLDDWTWQSGADGRFELKEGDKVLRSVCIAMNQAAPDDKRSARKNLFGGDEDAGRKTQSR